MLLARRTAALEARKGASALGQAAAVAAGRTESGLRPLPPKEWGRLAGLHISAAPTAQCAPPGGGGGGGGGGGRIFNRLKVAGGDAPGIRTPGTTPAAGLGRRKSTAAALMDEGEEDLAEGSARGRQGEDGDGGGRLTSFRLTDIGEGIMEVEVLQWFVSPGDRVSQFDKLCEVQSDKANVEITSRYDGVVRKIHWDVGDMVQTGSVLVEIEELAARAADGGGSSMPAQAFLSSEADADEEPAFPVPRSPCPAEAAAAVVSSIPALAGVVEPGQGSEVLNSTGVMGGVGTGAGGSERRQVLATPAVRRLCRELSVDLSHEPVSGTGPGGRVLKGDVLVYADNRKTFGHGNTGAGADNSGMRSGAYGEVSRPQRAGLGGLAAYGDQEEAPPAAFHGDDDGPGSLSAFSAGRAPLPPPRPIEGVPMLSAAGSAAVGVEAAEVEQPRRPAGVRERKEPVSVPIKGIQKAMMEAMQRALEVPHMTFCDEVNADRLGQLRSDLAEAAERRGVRLSYLPLIVKATSMALSAFPTLNASLSEDRKSLLQHPGHNIGVAMDTSKGLLVPCIPSVEEMSVLDIAEELNALQRLGAAGKLGEAELSGTTFTLSNIGSIGGTYASPVILHPQVCIGALGRMQRVPRFDPSEPEKVVAARVFPVSWAADHRVVDGGTLARFSNTWKSYLENPALMLADTR